MGTCGLAAGAEEVRAAAAAYLREKSVAAEIKPVGCIGLDEEEVLLDVKLPGEARLSYGKVTPSMVPRIVDEHVAGGSPVADWVLGTVPEEGNPYPELAFYKKQRRHVLERCGYINPERIEDYLGAGGYGALLKVLAGMSKEEVVAAVKQSGLRGRGGAGFPTGLKWELTASARGEKKYVVCNADEGDPGAFMDRALLEGDPHSVLEGMMIGAYALGASEGYIYVRAEYPLAIKRLRLAINQAKKHGLLGENILGTGFNFDLRIKEGAGAFVCGEETALLNSLEGKRGMPRPRPPFPAEKGLWGRPTNINNVETWANVPLVIGRGPGWFKETGTEKSRGTKIFALTGKVRNTGLVEVPMGTTIREIVEDIGGGVPEGKKCKGVQIGGPSGGCLPEALFDTPVDYDSLALAGSMMGSGGLVVFDDSTCMVEFARFFTRFMRRESCGKCTPCREGTQRLLEILDRIIAGEGSPGDLDRLEELGRTLKDASLCGLGQTAPNPILSTLRYFREEYEAHLRGECLAGACRLPGPEKRGDEAGKREAGFR
ncbi:MAG: NADH-quinone oxidoreductase subunit NuoF [Peptococcaceae bacterium]|nr:NADH-quinone oxidoreductase subunit NuoF [Peptococcaceae bacterium]MDH7524493.1 NADH-quinone oxidoreductase subunit NuoF [Peptococcaceae bacterium]